MKYWKVTLAVPGTTHTFDYLVEAEMESGAVAQAIAEYSNAYVVVTREIGQWTQAQQL